MAKRSFAVIGLGRFGSAVATTLAELGHEVIGMDQDPDRVRYHTDVLTQVLEIDATDEKALRATGIKDVDAAVVSIGENVEASLLIVMTLKDLGVDEVVAKATTALHGRILERIGVSKIIYPERDMGVRLAHSLTVTSVVDYIELSRDFSLVEITAPAAFVGQSLKDLALRQRYGLMAIAIKRRDAADRENMEISPGGEEIIYQNDVLVLLGHNTRLAQLEKLFPR